MMHTKNLRRMVVEIAAIVARLALAAVGSFAGFCLGIYIWLMCGAKDAGSELDWIIIIVVPASMILGAIVLPFVAYQIVKEVQGTHKECLKKEEEHSECGPDGTMSASHNNTKNAECWKTWITNGTLYFLIQHSLQ